MRKEFGEWLVGVSDRKNQLFFLFIKHMDISSAAIIDEVKTVSFLYTIL